MTLYAATGTKGNLVIKRVPVSHDIQQHVVDYFLDQRISFEGGVENIIDYDGQYTPADDELLAIRNAPEIPIFRQAVDGNALALPEVNTADIESEQIKALMVEGPQDANGSRSVLVQAFQARQNLTRGFPLILQANRFRALQESAFNLAPTLTATIAANEIRFRSDFNLRRFIDLDTIFREATDAEVRAFAQQAQFEVADEDAFVDLNSTVTRKLITSITSRGHLQGLAVADIQAAGAETSVPIIVTNGRIVLPTDKAGVRLLLKFLAEDRYNGPLSGDTFESSSKRLAD